jgi:hypothetical protein
VAIVTNPANDKRIKDLTVFFNETGEEKLEDYKNLLHVHKETYKSVNFSQKNCMFAAK